jgi:hypothetical protein
MRLAAIACMVPALAAAPAPAQDVAPALGKERAAASTVEWRTRESVDLRLGNVRAAFTASPIETRIMDASVFTRATVSCETSSRKVAIEIANASAADLAGGVKPTAMPVLLCSRPIAPWDAKLIQESSPRAGRSTP